MTSNQAALTVTAAPSITRQPAAQAVCPGGTATFSVTASGQAPLTYQWKKDGANVSGATAATLQITGVDAGDVGSYTCVVTDACCELDDFECCGADAQCGSGHLRRRSAWR